MLTFCISFFSAWIFSPGKGDKEQMCSRRNFIIYITQSQSPFTNSPFCLDSSLSISFFSTGCRRDTSSLLTCDPKSAVFSVFAASSHLCLWSVLWGERFCFKQPPASAVSAQLLVRPASEQLACTRLPWPAAPAPSTAHCVALRPFPALLPAPHSQSEAQGLSRFTKASCAWVCHVFTACRTGQ